MLFLFTSKLGHQFWLPPMAGVVAVSVQRLNVPDLVVIDQLNQQQQPASSRLDQQLQSSRTQSVKLMNATNSQSPEAASLINQDLNGAALDQPQQITFECLISFDRRKDKNLVVKWHHDDRIEPIYQWIPELNKRSIAPQYRAYIAPIVAQQQVSPQVSAPDQAPTAAQWAAGSSAASGAAQNGSSQNSIQLLEAGFRLVRPSKELGAPPRSFRFNASRTDIGALLASQRERLIQPSMIAPATTGLLSSTNNNNQLPLAYRMRGFDGGNKQLGQTTISPQMYSTIDYVNVNQNRARQSPSSPWLIGHQAPTSYLPAAPQGTDHQPPVRAQQTSQQRQPNKHNGVKLVCDIDQVFPVPEVSIYRLAKLDGSHPDKLAKLDTRIERNPLSGLYHVQVISVLEDDELQMKYGLNEPVYFECLIALTNLELSKYSDNKRSIIYRPVNSGLLANSPLEAQTSEDINLLQAGNSAAASTRINPNQLLIALIVIMSWLVYRRCI